MQTNAPNIRATVDGALVEIDLPFPQELADAIANDQREAAASILNTMGHAPSLMGMITQHPYNGAPLCGFSIKHGGGDLLLDCLFATYFPVDTGRQTTEFLSFAQVANLEVRVLSPVLADAVKTMRELAAAAPSPAPAQGEESSSEC
jgi:hypothetical protein